MIWARRRFAWAEYAPYLDKLAELQLKMAPLHAQFTMVHVDTEKTGVSDYFISLPHAALLPFFDGFETVSEAELPKKIDGLDLGDSTDEEFTSRFAPRPREEHPRTFRRQCH